MSPGGGAGPFPPALGSDSPITSISVADLYVFGLGDLAVADLNHDGVLDILDMYAFIGGARPSAPSDEPPAEAQPAPTSGRDRRAPGNE